MLNGQSQKQKLIVPSLRGPIRDLKSRSWSDINEKKKQNFVEIRLVRYTDDMIRHFDISMKHSLNVLQDRNMPV